MSTRGGAHNNCTVQNLGTFCFSDVSGTVEWMQTHQYMVIVDRHVIVFVKRLQPLVQTFTNSALLSGHV